MKARLLVLASLLATAASTKPHIIVILADDLGWNDVSFHGSSQIPTPNIDALAYNGVVLNSHYVPALCTPSRASLMTGKYPTHTGTQHLVILGNEPWGLPLTERLLPEHLKAAGYATHAVGKWHLGFHRSEYTPTRRGFDSHYGYWNGYQDYYDHSMRDTLVPFKGYDMRRGLRVDWGARGEYSTDLFTREAVRVIEQHDSAAGPLFLYLAHLAPHTGNPEEPFQAPDEEVAKFAHIEDPERRVYAAMVSKLDQSVGEVMTALSARGMLNNSVVLFLSDNGAPTFGIHSNRGSNFPLRGMKESPWEGGVRGVAALWSPLVRSPQRVSQQLVHMSDWLPTLWSAAGQDVRELGDIDGVDQWAALLEDRASPRAEVLHNIDPVEDYAALRRGDWKLVEGSTQEGAVDGWYGESGSDAPRYDVNAVLRSPAGAAIAGLVTKLQIRRKGAQAPRILTEAIATALRRSATVHCPLTPEGNATACRPREAPCLFNIRDDPCETANLAQARPLVLHSLQRSLARFRRTMVKPLNVPGDPGADPALWNGTWVSWKDGDSDGVATLPPAPTHGAPTLHKLVYAAAAALSVVALTASLRRKRKTA